MITTVNREVFLGRIELIHVRENPFSGMFQNMAMPLVRRSFPELFAHKVVSVQALGANNGRG
jgi:hypothetical protein